MSTLATFRTEARLRIPEIGDTDALTDANFLILLNRVQKEFLKQTLGYPTSTIFQATSGTAFYVLSTAVPAFFALREMGLWYQSSATATRRQLKPYTLAELGARIPGWRSASAGTPTWYVLDGDDLIIHPKPSSTYASGLELYHFSQGTDLTADAQYLFTASTTLELKYLIPHEEVLLDGLRWMAFPLLDKHQEAAGAGQTFLARCQEVKSALKWRADMKRWYRPKVSTGQRRTVEQFG